MKKTLIAAALAFSLAGVANAASSSLPDPVAFANAMELGDVGQARVWLAKGLPAEFQGSRLGSGLMIGAWEGNVELMRVFLAAGANIEQQNEHGETALVLAAWRGHRRAVDWLLENGAKINAGERQWSALHYAVFGGHAELVDHLLDKGANINALSTNGSSVLMMAAYEGHTALARKLIEKGADPRPKNDWGDGALEWAMRYNRTDIAKLVTTASEYAEAMNKPKIAWGEPKRSFGMTRDMATLLSMRSKLEASGRNTESIDKRIATERMRIVRADMDRRKMPEMMPVIEVSASRTKPSDQSVSIIAGPANPAATVPPAAPKLAKAAGVVLPQAQPALSTTAVVTDTAPKAQPSGRPQPAKLATPTLPPAPEFAPGVLPDAPLPKQFAMPVQVKRQAGGAVKEDGIEAYENYN